MTPTTLFDPGARARFWRHWAPAKQSVRLDGQADDQIVVLPDGTLVTGSKDHTVRRWNPETGAEIGEPIVHQEEVTALAVEAGRVIGIDTDADSDTDTDGKRACR